MTYVFTNPKKKPKNQRSNEFICQSTLYHRLYKSKDDQITSTVHLRWSTNQQLLSSIIIQDLLHF